MHNLKPKQILLFIALFSYSSVFASQKQIDTGFIKHTVDVLNHAPPIEKVYLQLDQFVYEAGGDIWFKAYLTSGCLHQLSLISGLLYVELVNDASQAVEQAVKLQVKYGLCYGDFHLSNTLPPGQYHVRAYTNYMRNAGADYFFNQPVSISNVTYSAHLLKVPAIPQSNHQAGANMPVARQNNLQFFPESGSLVNGINSNVAFKAVAPNGKGMEVSGVITDNDGMEITRFASLHKGMGSFNIYPVAGKTYKAAVIYADSSHSVVKLPVAADAGYVLSLNNQAANNFISIRISYKNDRVKGSVADSSLTLVAQSGGLVCYTAKILLHGSITSGRVPKEKFPTGIARFTLFSPAGEPLCERASFINNHDQLNINVASSAGGNGARQPTALNIHVTAADGKPARGSFSASVIHTGISPPGNAPLQGNILSSFLLTSDLKGTVEEPGYYFYSKSDTATAAVDLLMLTQGYRRFEWQQALNKALPANAFPPEAAFTIAGTLTNAAGKPVGGGHISLFNKETNFISDTVSAGDGSFAFHNLVFNDSLRFSLIANGAKGEKDVFISVNEASNPAYGQTGNGTVNLLIFPSGAANGQKTALAMGDNTLLKEVKVKAVPHSNNYGGTSAYSANLNGPGNADQILSSKDLDFQGSDLASILAGKIAGVQVVNGALVSSRSGSFRQSRNMLVILDGNYFTGSLSEIYPPDVASIEVLKSAANTSMYGSRGGNGVIVITTKHAGDEGYKKSSNTAVVTLTGFYKARVFYVPAYESSKTGTADMPVTFFWKPDLVTDEQGNAVVNYINGAAKGNYQVIIEGIDLMGNPGFKVYNYKID